jgi:hypothetical protein
VPGSGELPVEYQLFFRIRDKSKSLKAVTKSFHLFNYFLNEVVERQAINTGSAQLES